MDLHTPVIELNRVGKSLAEKLANLGIIEIKDLIWHFPFRYEDFSKTVDIKELVEGEQVTVRVKIELIANKRSYRKRKIITEALVADQSGHMKVVWFGQPFITKLLKQGDSVYLSGKVNGDMFGMNMISPAYEKVKAEATHTARIVPLYPLTNGITQKQMRFLTSQVMNIAKQVPDWLPSDILEKADLIPLSNALLGIHFPSNNEDLRLSEKRLKFDELFILQLRGEAIRQSLRKSIAKQIKFKEAETRKLVSSLGFQLTKKQKITAWEILQDMNKSTPMNRLLEGDVGSGKTVVAALAMLNCILNKMQTLIMAPTEVLASQHFSSLQKIFAKHDVAIGLITRSSVIQNKDADWIDYKSIAKRKQGIVDDIKKGKVQILVGTHAILSEEVKFNDLGLVVVDEQHRFGVEQRKIIRDKSGNPRTMPHFLSMTATPIPRSFALTLYGELDISVIDELPIGRKIVKTKLVDTSKRQQAYYFIKQQIKQGRQCFVICPLISDDSNPLTGNEKKSVMNEFQKLSKEVFPSLRIGYLHGKLPPKAKERTMKDFNQGKIDILVTTSVVEVGIDVPNASVMMIEGADRFGLAQLHQFRGRVGRNENQSYCLLFTDSDSPKSMQRLKFFSEHSSGFAVSEYDLKTRGPGEVYGTAQSGMMNFRLASMHDFGLIKLTRKLAQGIDFDKYPVLLERVKAWEKKVHLE